MTSYRLKLCKTKRAYEAELARPATLDFDALRRSFAVQADAGALLVLADFGGVVVHKYGKLTFKSLKDEAAVRGAARAIYKRAL